MHILWCRTEVCSCKLSAKISLILDNPFPVLLMVESSKLWNLKLWTSNKSNLDFDKRLSYCTCLRKMFEMNYLRGKFNQLQFVRNVLVYVFGVFTFSFCCCFYEGFIPKSILVSGFLPFIYISYPIKVFRFDTGILLHSCAVPFKQTTTEYNFFMPDFVSHVCLQLVSISPICNNNLLNVNKIVSEFCCSTGFCCAFSWLWGNQWFLNFEFWFR